MTYRSSTVTYRSSTVERAADVPPIAAESLHCKDFQPCADFVAEVRCR